MKSGYASTNAYSSVRSGAWRAPRTGGADGSGAHPAACRRDVASAARSAPVRGRLLSVAPVFARSYRCVLIFASDIAAATPASTASTQVRARPSAESANQGAQRANQRLDQIEGRVQQLESSPRRVPRGEHSA